ncbi:MAG: GAF domain-containing protein [Methylobacter sp.]
MTNIPIGLEEALKHCANEAIQHIGQIQPYGTLITLDQNLRILQISENTLSFFKLKDVQLFNQPISLLIGESNAKHIASQILRQNEWNDCQIPRVLNLPIWVNLLPKPANLILQLHQSEGLILAEFAYSSEFVTKDLFSEIMQPLATALRGLTSLQRLDHYVQSVVEEIRAITGYDRVTMYRFDSHWDGEVIAETHAEGMESFLGLHFPASDIPPQARKLYSLNHFRLLADTEVQPCAIVPADNPLTGKPLDLSFAVLRSFSPVHIQYLRNMNVRASMSISLLQNGKLWGLIACHHRKAKYLNYQVRTAAELICNIVSNKLSELENVQRTGFQKQIHEAIFNITRHVLASSEQMPAILESVKDDILSIMTAKSCVLGIGGQRFVLGEAPPLAELETLYQWLSDKVPAEVFYTDCLSNEIDSFAEFKAIASGMLIAPISKDLSDFVLWLRPEQLSSVEWAGLPATPNLNDQQQYRLTPRTSFQSWKENRQGYSKAWSTIEIGEAYNLALSLIIAFSAKTFSSPA